MGTLEEKVQHLEQQLSRLYQHIGTPNGALFAPYEKVATLETIVQKQQVKLDLLEQTQVLFLQSVPQYLEEQVKNALQQRGSKGADFVAITQFVTAHLANAIVSLQEACFKTVHESLPFQAIQALEKKVQTTLQNSSTNSDLQSLQTLQTRLTLLELQQTRQESRQETNQPNQTNTPTVREPTNELTNMKEHIEHLETKLLQQVEKAYNTVHTPGSMGLPLAKLQTLVTTLNTEFQTFRQMDVRKVAESMITAAHQNLRKEFTAFLETCISKKEYSQFESTVQRIEEYTKDVRGGFYTLKNQYDALEHDLTERFSEERWASLKKVERSMEMFLQGRNSMEHYLRQIQNALRGIEDQKRSLDQHIRTVEEDRRKYEYEVQVFQNKQSKGVYPLAPLPPIEPTQLRTPSKPAYRNKDTSIYQSLTKCVYTAIMGSDGQQLDTLGQVDRIPGWDYICFTNQSFQNPRGWTVIQVEYLGTNPVLEAKRYKWLSHEILLDYDVVLWVDAYITPKLDMRHKLKEWILSMKHQQNYILHRPHDVRSCIWDECDAVVKSKRDTAENVNKVRKLLQKNSMPKGWGLFDTNIVVRFHKQQIVQELGEAIYKQLSTVSTRDQLAVTYVYYKHNFANYITQDLFEAFQKNGTHIRINA